MNGNDILKKLKKNVNSNEYTKYIRKVIFSEDLSSKNNLVFIVPNILILKWIKTKYFSFIFESYKLETGNNPNINIILKKNIKKQSLEPLINIEDKDIDTKQTLLALNPSFKFDTFIVGVSNQFAYTTSMAVTKNPGKEFNPLVIYGNVGLGKTHLLQAIGNESKNKNVICITAEQFINDFTSSLLNKNSSGKNMQIFKKKYRNCKFLLIDDIQFISGKPKVQEEFFHTFNELHLKSSQIVLTSDKKPSEIVGLEDRLKSRFEMGITTNIKHPDLETKIGIIKKKCEIDNININNNIITYIATNLTSSIREIEGVLMKLNAYANMLNQEINLEFTKNVLKDHITKNDNIITLEIILNAVSKSLNIKPSEIRSKSKNKQISEARRITIYLARELTKDSMSSLASFFLMKDHSSISHALRKIKKDINDNNKYLSKLDSIKANIIK